MLKSVLLVYWPLFLVVYLPVACRSLERGDVSTPPAVAMFAAGIYMILRIVNADLVGAKEHDLRQALRVAKGGEEYWHEQSCARIREEVKTKAEVQRLVVNMGVKDDACREVTRQLEESNAELTRAGEQLQVLAGRVSDLHDTVVLQTRKLEEVRREREVLYRQMTEERERFSGLKKAYDQEADRLTRDLDQVRAELKRVREEVVKTAIRQVVVFGEKVRTQDQSTNLTTTAAEHHLELSGGENRCPDCDGGGTVRHRPPDAHGDSETVCCPRCNPDTDGSGWGQPRCWKCRGFGTISVSVPITDKVGRLTNLPCPLCQPPAPFTVDVRAV